ncbi:hypothetical protein [Streptomyces sp. NPDC048111]|uniref:hypothetical protein n=1 Tax=Streptomyces sp. NPDC048111 TaxID=3365500 RepID=UPI00371C6DE3
MAGTAPTHECPQHPDTGTRHWAKGEGFPYAGRGSWAAKPALLLIDDHEDSPLALGHALAPLGRRLDRTRDVPVLLITGTGRDDRV